MSVFFRVCASLLAVATAVTLPRQRQTSTSDTSVAATNASEASTAEQTEQARLSMVMVAATNAPAASPAEQIEQTRLSMAAASGDLEAQLRGCNAMQALADAHRVGPFRQVSTEVLKAGIGETLAQGLLNAVAIDSARGLKEPGTASYSCLGSIIGLDVDGHYDSGLALISGAPHLWQSIVTMFKTFKGSQFVNDNMCIFAGLFGTPQASQPAASLVEAGGIDFVLGYLEDESLKSDPAMWWRVYCALSDNVHEASGVVARSIANYGGPLQGIPLLVRSLRWAKESGSTFHADSKDGGYGLLYEGVHDVGGVLEHDDANHSFAKAFLDAGLVEQLVPIMREEPGDRTLQDMACEVVKWITDDNVAVQTQLAEMGVLEIIAEALKRHSHPPYIIYGAVTIACSTALLNFASTSETWREQLRSLGVYDTLNLEVFIAFPPFLNTDFMMRQQWFPNSNIVKLKKMLEPIA